MAQNTRRIKGKGAIWEWIRQQNAVWGYLPCDNPQCDAFVKPGEKCVGCGTEKRKEETARP